MDRISACTQQSNTLNIRLRLIILTDKHFEAVIPVQLLTMAATGRKYLVTTGRFQETKFHRPLSGDEVEELTVASRLDAVSQSLQSGRSTFKVTVRLLLATLRLTAGLRGYATKRLKTNT